jgi:hypothetical protein
MGIYLLALTMPKAPHFVKAKKLNKTYLLLRPYAFSQDPALRGRSKFTTLL